MKKTNFKKVLSVFLTILMVMSCWVWVAPNEVDAVAAATIESNLTVLAQMLYFSFYSNFIFAILPLDDFKVCSMFDCRLCVQFNTQHYVTLIRNCLPFVLKITTKK